MVESSARYFEAAFVVERRARRWTWVEIGGYVAVYALILGILVATDFR